MMSLIVDDLITIIHAIMFSDFVNVTLFKYFEKDMIFFIKCEISAIQMPNNNISIELRNRRITDYIGAAAYCMANTGLGTFQRFAIPCAQPWPSLLLKRASRPNAPLLCCRRLESSVHVLGDIMSGFTRYVRQERV
jgi:hypothetical protein